MVDAMNKSFFDQALVDIASLRAVVDAFFDEVMVVTLPRARSSVVFAGVDLPFDQNALSEIVSQSGEEEYLILGAADIKSLADGNPLEP